MLYEQTEVSNISQIIAKKPLWLWVLVGSLIILGFASIVFGLYQLFSTNEQEIVTSQDIETQVCEQTAEFGQLTVYISGAIVSPGVYILNSSQRVVDLLEAAGGVSLEADTVYINKQLNLAKRLSDGEQLYIPTKEETVIQLTSLSVTEDSQSPISINSSTQEKLEELSGVGSVRAEKIIKNRPYNSLIELVEKSVLTQSLFDEIKPKIVL